MPPPFLIGVSPDFFTDAKGSFEFALDALCQRQPHVQWEAMPDPVSLLGYDAILALATAVDATNLAGPAAARFLLVARWGVGYDKIDTGALTAFGAALAITPGAVRTPVAEAIFTLMLALAKNLRAQDQVARAGRWRADLPGMGRNLRGMTLGSVGFGNIAREMFRLAAPFGFARLLGADPYGDPEAAHGLGVELVSLDEVMRAADVVTINCLLNDSTRGLIGERELRLMKSTAYFINTARGPIVQEAALVRALEQRWIAGAGLDVYEQEPPRPDHPLFALDNVIVTPHGLPWTQELARDNSLEACANLEAVAQGKPPHGLVNREVLANPAFAAKLERFRAA
jgi:D-3-phosphoglycerate dehydrogenase